MVSEKGLKRTRLDRIEMRVLPLLALNAVLSAAATVKGCGGAFTLLSASLNNTNPSPGDAVNLHLEYSVPSPIMITDGTAEYAVTYNFIPMSPTVEPLCANVPCPLGPGTYKNDTVANWPTGLSGKISTIMKWFDPSRFLLLCLNIAGSVAESSAIVPRGFYGSHRH